MGNINHSDLQGWASEKNVENILKRLKLQGYISGFRKSKKYDYEDVNGVDFVIYIKPAPNKRFGIDIQVKSSDFFLKEHSDRPGQDIPAVNGQSEKLEEDILNIITDYKMHINAVRTIASEKPASPQSAEPSVLPETLPPVSKKETKLRPREVKLPDLTPTFWEKVKNLVTEEWIPHKQKANYLGLTESQYFKLRRTNKEFNDLLKQQVRVYLYEENPSKKGWRIYSNRYNG